MRKLPKLAWEATLDVYRAVLGRDDVVPGMVAGIQTAGRICQWHPDLHCLTTYGAFTADGTFVPLPDDLETNPTSDLLQSPREKFERKGGPRQFTLELRTAWDVNCSDEIMSISR